MRTKDNEYSNDVMFQSTPGDFHILTARGSGFCCPIMPREFGFSIKEKWKNAPFALPFQEGNDSSSENKCSGLFSSCC